MVRVRCGARAKRVLVLAAILMAAVAGTRGRATAQVTPPREVIRVLFVCSSYTWFNNMGDIVAGIAAADPEGPIIVPTLAPYAGASSLQRHLDNGATRKLIRPNSFDYVILQETSLMGGSVADGRPVIGDPPTAFYEAVRTWVPLVRGVGAKPLLLMTWGRRLPRPDGPSEMQADVAKAYLFIGSELGVEVAPVGLAWEEARSRLTTVELHSYDGSHPSAAGSYLSALVVYSTITGRDPMGAPAVIYGRPFTRVPASTYGGTIAWRVVDVGKKVPLVDLREATAAELQRVAWQVVSERGQ